MTRSLFFDPRRAIAILGMIATVTASSGAQTGAPPATWAFVHTASPCHAASSGDAGALLRSAATALGMSAAEGRVVHEQVTDLSEQNYQSDRWYPPFFSYTFARELWYDPATGVERSASRMMAARDGPPPPVTTLSTARTTVAVRDTAMMPVAQLHVQTIQLRPLNAWAEILDWTEARDARVTGTCVYRDYPRTVLSRPGVYGEERLYLDPKTSMPVALEREEPHYLWGQVRVEYVWSTWLQVGNAVLPGMSFRQVDGARDMERVFGTTSLVSRDSAPAMRLPASAPVMAVELPLFLKPTVPDTVRIGPHTFLLGNVGFREIVTLQRDTVFVLDATQGDDRARADSVWIGRLFPGRHPIVVVVTDVAWPHIAGVRFWVASGATIVSHAVSRPFLERVVARRWTRTPDVLERRRASARLTFRALRDSLSLGGGSVRLYPIDGITSEGALLAWLPGDRFLWASDYVQQLREPAEYTTEVWRAVQRIGIAPSRVAAQHLPLAEWARVEAMATHR